MGDLGLIAPEIILLIGGLFIFCLDLAYDPGVGKKSGLSYMALAALFLGAALVAVVLQLNISEISEATPEPVPKVAFSMMTIDNFGSFIKVTVFAGMILTAIAGGRYMNRRSGNQGEFWTFFLMVSLAMSIAASANNLVLVYLAIEFLSITSYMLAGFLRDNRRSNEAGLKYFLYGSIASAVMLYGISLLYGATGSLYIHDIAAAFGEIMGDSTEVSGLAFAALPAMLLVLAGLGFKASLAPFYQWAPDTYDGSPTPVATYLSTASKAAAFAVLARFFVVGMASFEVNWVPVLAAFSIITMTMGNLAALRQSSVKRMLAYSSVAQAGYILMGLVAVTSASTSAMDGLNGVLLYLFAYLFTNVGAFLVVMALEETVDSTHINAYRGLIKRAPWLAVMFTVFLLSLTGIPATGGFLGKAFVFGAAIQRQYFWLAAIGMINAGIAAFYYLRVIRAMFFTEEEEEDRPLDVPIALQTSLLVCAVATIWIGVYPSPVIDWVSNASVQLLSVVP
ncbi:MAG: NADH-quinone oxidoreductase subunit N [Caldilineaceae bacterium]|nr:NADH-quinone oxidoreductase subunit N [Caldilineaceae bacterium]